MTNLRTLEFLHECQEQSRDNGGEDTFDALKRQAARHELDLRIARAATAAAEAKVRMWCASEERDNAFAEAVKDDFRLLCESIISCAAIYRSTEMMRLAEFAKEMLARNSLDGDFDLFAATGVTR